jgi:hypothetical protein
MTVILEHLDLAVQDDEHVYVTFSPNEQESGRLDNFFNPEPAEALDYRITEARKGAVG